MSSPRAISALGRIRVQAALLPIFVLLLSRGLASAEGPRALPADQLPKDPRLQPLKDLDGYFPFTVPATRDDWAARSESVRRRVSCLARSLAAAGADAVAGRHPWPTGARRIYG